jgi:putative transposase
LAVNCGKLCVEINYLHRQQYSDYVKLDWNPQPYNKHVPLVGSATAQQIVRKNNEAWPAFLALKRMEKNSEARLRPKPVESEMRATTGG